MKDEINIKMPGQILDYVDTKEHLLELFNYITNLQQIEQDHKKLNGELREENKKLNNIIKGFDLYFKKMVDDRPTEEISQLGMTAYIEYNCLCIVKSFYEQLKDETDEILKELEGDDNE